MFGVFYAIGKLLGFIKDTIVDDVTDSLDRQNRKINDIAYVSDKGLTSYATGHTLSFINSHIYKDDKTLKIVKVPLSEKDIEKEKSNREEAIQNGYKVYRCCDYYLPDDKTVGSVYKSIDNDRLYVERQIKNSLLNKHEPKINGFYLISIMPDNYGYVERNYKGELISGNDLILKDHYFNLKYSFFKDDEYIWKV